ncbi:hypothetical protein DFH27DRAFT_312394 [Peziza echinospora]|nr:hypothetical protein DFH27DRAFT_312394 [Peziza echinospora]
MLTSPQPLSATKLQSTTITVVEDCTSPGASSSGLTDASSERGKNSTELPLSSQRRLVRFAEHESMDTPAPQMSSVIPTSEKPKKAKSAAKSTLKFTGKVMCGLFGCVAYMLSKACSMDGGYTQRRVVVSRPQSRNDDYAPRPRVVAYDQRYQRHPATGRVRVPAGAGARPRSIQTPRESVARISSEPRQRSVGTGTRTSPR